MQQRQPRLGDILDDYCPRERRITNHAVVAMVGQDVKQTRCTTCDAEHEYKNARIPAQRKKKTGTAALYDEVLTGMPRKPIPVSVPAEASRPVPEPVSAPEVAEAEATEATAPPAPVTAAGPDPAEAAAPATSEVDGPVHRPLIRATLPRPEGQPKERPLPEFTVRAANAKPGRFRPPGGHAHGFGQAGRRGPGSNQPGSLRFGARRGHGQGHVAAAGAPVHGNRARPAHGERQGESRRRGGKKR